MKDASAERKPAENSVRFAVTAEAAAEAAESGAAPRKSGAVPAVKAAAHLFASTKKRRRSSCKDETLLGAGDVATEPRRFRCPLAENEVRRKSLDLLMNTQFNKLAELITQYVGEVLADVKANKSETFLIQKIRKLGDIHYEKGIIIPPTSWRDFKQAFMAILAECSFDKAEEQKSAMEAWTSLLAVFIREMKLAMLGACGDCNGQNNGQLQPKHSMVHIDRRETS